MTTLEKEAREAPAAAREQRVRCADLLDALGRSLREHPPTLVMTCARGSSDHAATYGKYLLETTVGQIVASVGPSLASVYQRAPAGLKLEGALLVAVSQSGRSPDLVALAQTARAGGARVVGLINDEASPLAAACELVIPLCAGDERGVAATKSFLLTGTAFLCLAAAWSGDPALAAAAAAAPDALEAAGAADLSALAAATSAFVIARGVGLGAASELALKLKETCRLHAEAFSAAEVAHGPVALVGPGFPVVALAQDDETAAGTRETAARLAALGASVTWIPSPPGVPAVVAPLCQTLAGYLALPALAAARGVDPEAPRHLRKVTETV